MKFSKRKLKKAYQHAIYTYNTDTDEWTIWTLQERSTRAFQTLRTNRKYFEQFVCWDFKVSDAVKLFKEALTPIICKL